MCGFVQIRVGVVEYAVHLLIIRMFVMRTGLIVKSNITNMDCDTNQVDVRLNRWYFFSNLYICTYELIAPGYSSLRLA